MMMAKPRSHLYEGMYILSATLSDEARQKALDKVTSGIEERGGEIHKTFDQGRKKFAYEINGRREGYYYLLYFSIRTEVMTEMWKEYHLNEDLLRFMTLRAEKVPEKLEFKSIAQE
jgi:small subunit ribosomal protein S6